MQSCGGGARKHTTSGLICLPARTGSKHLSGHHGASAGIWSAPRCRWRASRLSPSPSCQGRPGPQRGPDWPNDRQPWPDLPCRGTASSARCAHQPISANTSTLLGITGHRHTIERQVLVKSAQVLDLLLEEVLNNLIGQRIIHGKQSQVPP